MKKVSVNNKPLKSVTYFAQWALTIKWDGNGGTIGSKKTISTEVKENTKIGKFPTTPKRDGFTFKGWFTKKTGGEKINTNVKLSNSVTYNAHWENNNKKLVGKWDRIISQSKKKCLPTGLGGKNNIGGDIVTGAYDFRKDGSYTYFEAQVSASGSVTLYEEKGRYTVYRTGNSYFVDLNYKYRGMNWDEVVKTFKSAVEGTLSSEDAQKVSKKVEWKKAKLSKLPVEIDPKRKKIKFRGNTFDEASDDDCFEIKEFNPSDLVGRWENIEGNYWEFDGVNYEYSDLPDGIPQSMTYTYTKEEGLKLLTRLDPLSYGYLEVLMHPNKRSMETTAVYAMQTSGPGSCEYGIPQGFEEGIMFLKK